MAGLWILKDPQAVGSLLCHHRLPIIIVVTRHRLYIISVFVVRRLLYIYCTPEFDIGICVCCCCCRWFAYLWGVAGIDIERSLLEFRFCKGMMWTIHCKRLWLAQLVPTKVSYYDSLCAVLIVLRIAPILINHRMLFLVLLVKRLWVLAVQRFMRASTSVLRQRNI